MSKSYYYFAATLPSITFDEKPPLTVEQFLNDCQRLMPANDYVRIEQALTQDPSSVEAKDGVFGQWIRYNHTFRNELAFARANQLSKDPLDHVRGAREVDPFICDVINQAMKAADPLSAEKILDKARWQFLEELITGHYFDFDVVLVYGLKLQILQRYELIKSNKGSELFEEIKGDEAFKEYLVSV